MTSKALRAAEAVASFAVAYASVRLVLSGLGWITRKTLGLPEISGSDNLFFGVVALGLVCALALPPYIAWRVYVR